MRALTGISIIVMAAALSACGSSGDGAGGAGGAGGGTTAGSPTGTGGDDTGTGTGGDATGTGGGGTCPDETYDCGAGDICLENGLCDGEVDCIDGSDEADCTSECLEDEYDCGPGDSCLDFSIVCDGTPDCDDGNDEQGCELGECADDEAQCASGACIPGDWVCDGEVDCGGGEDEDAEICDNGGICDSGVTVPDNSDMTFCLSVYCCAEFNECTADGTDVDGCLSCFDGDGSGFCDSAAACGFEFCGFGG